MEVKRFADPEYLAAEKLAIAALEACQAATTPEDFAIRREAYLRAEAHAAKLWTVYLDSAEAAAWRDATRKR